MLKQRFALGNCVGPLVVCLALAAPCGGRAEDLDGFWRTDGYGYLLEIDGKHLRAFERTAVSCIPAWTAVRTDRKVDGVEAVFHQEMAPVDVLISTGPSPESLYLGMPGDASRMVCHRLPRRPDLTTRPAVTPQNNFMVFWTTYAEHYPFFALPGVNWKAVRDKYEPRIKADMKPEELFAVLKEMIEPLHDAHTFLRARPIKGQFRGERPDPSPLDPKDFDGITAIIKKYRTRPADHVSDSLSSLARRGDRSGWGARRP
jgi:hypothetical protein